jgi:putative ABC transport system substrate-binding protein
VDQVRAPCRPSRRRLVQGAGLATLGFLAGCGQLPGQARTSPKVPRIGVIAAIALDNPNMIAFRDALRNLGYVEGQNLLVEWRSAELNYDQVPALAAELVHLPVDLIVAEGPTIPVAKEATSVLPIVMVGATDPVAAGWVASLARPGGNVTGPSNVNVQLNAKQLQLLQEVAPGASRVGVLWHRAPNQSSTMPAAWDELQSAAPVLGMNLQSLEVADAPDFERAFDAAARESADALLVLQDAYMATQRTRVVELALRSKLPTMYPRKAYIEAGGLMSYGVVSSDSARRSAYYVDRILKGAKPADLPVEQPTTFDFVINLQTAQALGLTIPQHVLLQATEVIQ